jgi:nucleotide-binding universal stress UspA family protein
MYSTILVPLDGSKRAETIFPYVEALAKCTQAKLILLNVVEPVHMLIPSAAVDLVESSLEADAIHGAVDYLRGVQNYFEDQGLQVDTVVEEGVPVKHILQVAERENVDLIAIASHGETGLARIFYGNVALGLLHRTDRPMLVVRSDGS